MDNTILKNNKCNENNKIKNISGPDLKNRFLKELNSDNSKKYLFWLGKKRKRQREVGGEEVREVENKHEQK